ncbi:SAM hydrolase/SAM-dependent halogenase family protein [Novispirillum sp. DQ9]|uniref:SAM hydrolase/SAM-dependent halogenase family protein n=1 Tax=Novispirillum sp. DQ9 TaxID=3398612 RepID=UPI003C7AFDA8
MIVLFTDFGLEGPYLGQVRAVLHRAAPGVPVVDLFSDLPPFDPGAAAYLLPAYGGEPFPEGTVVLAVVDPGVGTDRAPLVAQAGGRWFVGPDNGVLSRVIAQDPEARAWRVIWRPDRLSASFHGRDLFAPVAAALASGGRPGDGTPPLLCEHIAPPTLVGADWPPDRAAVVYVDRYGNAMTGLRADALHPQAVLVAGGRRIRRAATFGQVPVGEVLWYANANGLVEIACNSASAAEVLGMRVGSPVAVE